MSGGVTLVNKEKVCLKGRAREVGRVRGGRSSESSRAKITAGAMRIRRDHPRHPRDSFHQSLSELFLPSHRGFAFAEVLELEGRGKTEDYGRVKVDKGSRRSFSAGTHEESIR